MKHNLAVINSKPFTHDPVTRTLCIEHSDLHASDIFQRLYDDAADVGFALRSHKTDGISHWTLVTERRDRDNDVIDWEFKPLPEFIRKQPGLDGYRIIVFND